MIPVSHWFRDTFFPCWPYLSRYTVIILRDSRNQMKKKLLDSAL